MLLERLNLPQDLRQLSFKELEQVCEETRQFLIQTASEYGGHFASNLGMVELSVGLHAVYDTPQDKIVFDTGHQCYAHKILTGRMQQLPSIRLKGGLSGFLKRSESPYDEFGAGHASTSISAALGMAQARDLKGEDFSVAAVIGDGAMSGGLAFEGLNNARELKGNFTIILNDNDMSISHPVGALSKAITKLRLNDHYKSFRQLMMDKVLSSIPIIGSPFVKRLEETVELFRDFWFTRTREQAIIFEEMGFRYFGPIDGHDLSMVLLALKYAKHAKGPVILHFLTTKGKGYNPAELDPIKYHGVTKFEIESGKFISSKVSIPSYTQVFAKTLEKIAEKNEKVVVLTAAMIEGCGLNDFQKKFPDRLFDVGIAEGHCVTAAAGMAVQGLRPVCAIYSTFLQRAFDSVVHDVALQKLPVIFALDRGGIAGADGPTHHGLLDYSYLRLIPNLVHMVPKDENELQHMLYTAIQYQKGPIAFRFPRGTAVGVTLDEVFHEIPIGEAELIQKNSDTPDLLVLALGSLVGTAKEALEQIPSLKWALINARFVKPLDAKLILEWAQKSKHIITLEENNLPGGFGSAVLELLADHGMQKPVTRLGIPDQFIDHGTQAELLDQYGLSVEKLKKVFESRA